MLTEQQKNAVRLRCVDGLNVQQTAAVLGVHRCTIWRWSRKKEFRKEWELLLRSCRKQWQASRRSAIAEYNRKLNQLEADVDKAASNAKGRNTKALDKAWNAYSRHVFKVINQVMKTL